MVFGRDEFFGASNPPALLTCKRARVCAAGETAISKAQIMIAQRNAICVDQIAPHSLERGLNRSDRLRAKCAINDNFKHHINQQALKYANRVATCVHIHIEDCRLQRLRQLRDQQPLKVVFDEKIDGVCTAQHLHIVFVHIPIMIKVQTKTPHGVNGHAKIGSPTRIIGIIHIPAFAVHSLLGKLSYRLHYLIIWPFLTR